MLRLIAAAAMLLLAGCAGTPAAPITDLAGTEWRAILVNGRDTPATGDYSMRFSTQGEFSGRLGCNSMGGRYRVEGGRLIISNLVSTLMGCGEPAASFESQGLAILRQPMQISFTSNDRMGLNNGAGSIALDPVP